MHQNKLDLNQNAEEPAEAALDAARARRDAAIAATFDAQVERMRAMRPSVRWHAETRHHARDDGEALPSDTRILWGDQLRPVLVGTVLREGNHLLLTITDRSGAAPVVHEQRFATQDFI
ncbi:hypothetical protein [Cupriavidus sp. TMH.W2]|uniref:hypothetical protein n=1 Tax=Cupriavidus sp. TMH.W2 TaxID=3434465 RepID=UPI003D785219